MNGEESFGSCSSDNFLLDTEIESCKIVGVCYENEESENIMEEHMKKDSVKDIKIAFFDVDGTLVDMEKKVITPTMIETLKRLKENGIILCMATGRGPYLVPSFPGIDFDVFLSYNASYCYTKDEVIFSNPIPTEDVKAIVENAAGIHRPVFLAGVEGGGANGCDKDLADYFAIAKSKVNILDNFTFEKLMDKKVYQMMVGCYKEEYADILKDVDGARITAWWTRAADITPANGNKGVGVRKILDYYHLEKENAIAFGDGTNDIEMLEAVSTGVAMGNATDDVKAVADVICGHVAEDGIYHYCKEQGLI